MKLGVAWAKAQGAAGVLIALADMPLVTAAHVLRLFDAARDDHTVVASSSGRNPMPPALFGAGMFDVLLALDGDRGARDLVRSGRHVAVPPAELTDVDTPEDLERLRILARPARQARD